MQLSGASLARVGDEDAPLRPSLRYLFVLVAVAALVGGGLWWYGTAAPRVSAVQPQRGPAIDAVYATGTVEPIHWAQIASTETGRIVAYPAVEGARVAEGEVLIRLDSRKARGTIEELEARTAFLEADLKRYEALLKKSNVSRQAYERVKSELDQTRALARVARQKLADLIIVAPLDGIVLRKDGEIGEVVQAGDVLLWVGSDRPYWITAEVDEEDIPRVRDGQRALIKADAFPDRVLDGAVGEITPKGDPINKQYRVRVLLPVDSPLLVGMTTEVNIIARADEQALLIPQAALDGNVVWTLEDGHARRREVAVGVYGDALVEIRGGLADGTAVILDPPADLADGDPVRARRP
jgi:RND family efflux transporter MFP subunit